MQISNEGFLYYQQRHLRKTCGCSRAIDCALRLCWVSLGILVMLGFSMNCAPFYVCYFWGVAVQPNLQASKFFYQTHVMYTRFWMHFAGCVELYKLSEIESWRHPFKNRGQRSINSLSSSKRRDTLCNAICCDKNYSSVSKNDLSGVLSRGATVCSSMDFSPLHSACSIPII